MQSVINFLKAHPGIYAVFTVIFLGLTSMIFAGFFHFFEKGE